MICCHRWKETRRAYSLPAVKWSAETIDRETARQMIFGMTTVELRCDKCGLVSFVITDGVVPALPVLAEDKP